MASPATQRVVNCPHCNKPVPWSAESPYRPFCSERCKLIDLGQWANEEYRIPVVEDKTEEDGIE